MPCQNDIGPETPSDKTKQSPSKVLPLNQLSSCSQTCRHITQTFGGSVEICQYHQHLLTYSVISLMRRWSNTQWRVWWENKSGWIQKSECRRGSSLWGCEMEINREQKTCTYHKGEDVLWNAHSVPGHAHCHTIARLFPRCTSLTNQPVATHTNCWITSHKLICHLVKLG